MSISASDQRGIANVNSITAPPTPVADDRLKSIGAILAGQKSVDDVQKAARGSGLLGVVVAVIIGRLATRWHVELKPEDFALVVGAVVAGIGYAGTHWRTTRTAGLLGAAADRIERDLRRDVDR